MFRIWAVEETNHSREVWEMSLAHVIIEVEVAYHLGDLLTRNRVLMQDWANVLEKYTPAS